MLPLAERFLISPGRRRSLFREVNESIRGVSTTFGVEPATFVLLCECDQTDCLEPIEVPSAVFHGVRVAARRFLVSPGHEAHDAVVDRDRGYLVVNAGELHAPQLRVA